MTKEEYLAKWYPDKWTGPCSVCKKDTLQHVQEINGDVDYYLCDVCGNEWMRDLSQDPPKTQQMGACV
jgi:hypothetical protein